MFRSLHRPRLVGFVQQRVLAGDVILAVEALAPGTIAQDVSRRGILAFDLLLRRHPSFRFSRHGATIGEIRRCDDATNASVVDALIGCGIFLIPRSRRPALRLATKHGQPAAFYIRGPA